MLAVIGMIIVNLLANALPINGRITAEIYDRFQIYFVPAGYVVAIWGLMYIGFMAFAVYRALARSTRKPPPARGRLLVYDVLRCQQAQNLHVAR